MLVDRSVEWGIVHWVALVLSPVFILYGMKMKLEEFEEGSIDYQIARLAKYGSLIGGIGLAVALLRLWLLGS